MSNTKDFIGWLWRYLRDYQLELVVSFIGIVFYSLSNTAAIIYAFYELFEQWESGTLGNSFSVTVPEVPLLYPEGTELVIATGTPAEMVNQCLPYVIGIILIRVLSDFIRQFVMKYVGLSVGRDIRSELYENMIRRPITFFERKNVGDLISRLSSDINEVQGAVSTSLRNLVQAPLELVMAVGLVTYAAPMLSVFFLVIPICGFAIYKVGNRIKRYSRASQDVMGGLLSRMQERFSGIKLVKSAGRENSEISDFDRENQKHFRKKRRKIVVDSSLRPMMHLMIFAVGLAVAYLAFQLILSGYLSAAALGTFVVSIPWIYKPIRKLSGLNNTIQTSRGAAERIEQIFEDTFAEHQNLPQGDREPRFNDRITLDDVSYAYPDQDEMALRNVNLTLKKGQNLALVGPSGAGKSTLTDLLLRFFDPTQGECRLDGYSLKEYRLKEYRRMFGLVTQHSILFDDTITGNIRYGREEITDDEVREAADRAEALQFIQNLPDGFDTFVGEEGVRFSGGERQRIALARALAGDPNILVLDEATSDVDSRSEKKIIKAIENLPDSLSLVTISHALATVQFTEEILVLNDHEVEAVGTHDELLETSPTYKQLYEHQVDEVQTAFG